MTVKSKNLDDLSLLVDVCYSYYQHDETQSAIASRLGVSRATVCNLLAEARRRGIVSIEIHDPLKKKETIERELCKAYGLRDAKVVPVPPYGVANLKRAIGKAAADVVRLLIRSDDTIGISGGSTVLETVMNMEPLDLSGVTVVPLMGGLSAIEESTHGTEIARCLAEKVNGTVIVLSAPGMVEDAETRKIFVSNAVVRKWLEFGRKCSVAIVGIGTVKPDATIFRRGYLSESDLCELRGLGAVGDICLQFFDKDGVGCAQFNSRTVGVTLDDIKQIPLVIGVAGGGEGKAEGIRGALRGGYLDILVTDQRTAEEILQGD